MNIEVKPIDDTPGFDISQMMYFDDDDTVPRDDYEETWPRQPFFEPTGVAPKK